MFRSFCLGGCINSVFYSQSVVSIGIYKYRKNENVTFCKTLVEFILYLWLAKTYIFLSQCISLIKKIQSVNIYNINHNSLYKSIIQVKITYTCTRDVFCSSPIWKHTLFTVFRRVSHYCSVFLGLQKDIRLCEVFQQWLSLWWSSNMEPREFTLQCTFTIHSPQLHISVFAFVTDWLDLWDETITL